MLKRCLQKRLLKRWKLSLGNPEISVGSCLLTYAWQNVYMNINPNMKMDSNMDVDTDIDTDTATHWQWT